jgi:hypothetical protein
MDTSFLKKMENTHKLDKGLIFKILVELSVKETYLSDSIIKLISDSNFRVERRPKNNLNDRYYQRLGKEFNVSDSIIEELNYDFEMHFED